MLKRRIPFTALTILIVAVAATLSYETGRTLTLQDRITTTTTTTSATTVTTTSTATETKTSSTTVTETATKTTTSSLTVTTTATATVDSGNISTILTNGSVIAMRRQSNDSLLFTLSIDKQTYHYGETMHIRGTVTNLSPHSNISLFLTEYQIYLINSTGGEAWTSPLGIYDGLDSLRPPFEQEFTLKPYETINVPYATAEWNFTGLMVRPIWAYALYTGKLVPEGTYTIQWWPSYSTNWPNEGCCKGGFNQPITISFDVEK